MPTRTVLIVGIVKFGLLWSIVSGCHSSQQAAEQYYQEGLKHKEESEVLQAAEQFRLALIQNPQHVNAHVELGILLCHTRDYQQAIKLFLQAVEYGGPSHKSYAFIGYAYEQLGRLKLSERFYKRAIMEFPGIIDVRLRLADVLELQGKRQEAAAILQGILNIKPDIENADMIRSRVSLLEQPESPDVHLALADLYIRHGKIERGIAEYTKVEDLDSEHPAALVNFGIFCLKRDQFAPALAYFQHAKQLGRENQLEVRAGLGMALEKLGKWEEATQEYQAAVAIQPDWYEIHLKLAELFEKVGKFAEAADEFERVFRLSQRTKYMTREEEFPDANFLWNEILRLRGERSKKTIVQLKRSGRYNLVDVILNHHVPATLMIEERAKYTIISERLAQELGIQITPQTSEYRFMFAGRTYTAPLVNLPSLQVGGVEVRNVPTLIWNLSAYPEVNGLLGMSFLKHFQMEIDSADQLFVLTKLYS